MLLLVVGLVVIVLVILVVVFLSVRSMRADEGGGHSARPAGRGRAASGRHDFGGEDDFAGLGRPDGARRGQPGRQPARRGAAEDDWPSGREPDFGAPRDDEPEYSHEYRQPRAMARQDYGESRGYPGHDQSAGDRSPVPAAQRRFGALPRPRGHQHDQDPEPRRRPEDRGDARRGRRQESGSRRAGARSARPGADLPAGDWGGVSDEQYWAELAADKPLATTARSAQPGLDALPAAALRDSLPDAAADGAERQARHDEDLAWPPREAAPTMAAARGRAHGPVQPACRVRPAGRAAAGVGQTAAVRRARDRHRPGDAHRAVDRPDEHGRGRGYRPGRRRDLRLG